MGGQNERADAGRLVRLSEFFQQRKEKGKGFASTGLRRNHQIVAGELLWDSLSLHGRRLDEAMLGQVALQDSRKGQIGKGIHS